MVRPLALAALIALAPAGACRGDDPGGGADALEAPDNAPVEPATAAADAPDPATPPNRRRPEEEGRHEDDSATPTERERYGAAMVEADAALYSGLYERARERYLAALELQPDSMSPALGALRSMVLDRWREAREGLAARIQQKIDAYAARAETEGAAYLLASRLALALNDVGRALDEARLAVSRLPELGVAWRVLGEAAMAAELWGEAVDAFQTALSLGLQAESGTWERLADALDELGETAAAEEAAKKALALTGDDPNARRRRLNLLAVVHKHAGRLDAAHEAAEQARALGPDDPAVLHNLGSLAEADGRLEDAVALYERGLEVVPSPTTLWRLGHVQLKLDRPNDALASFQRAAGELSRWAWPASTRWLPAYDVGKLFARARRYRDAIGWFEDAMREARTGEATREIVSWLGYARTLLDEDVGGP